MFSENSLQRQEIPSNNIFLILIELLFSYVYIYIISRRIMTPEHMKYNSKSLDVVQSPYFGSKLSSSGTYKNLYVPDEDSLLPKYGDCTTSNDFELCICIYTQQC